MSTFLSIRARLGLLLVTFTSLVTISVAATLWMARTQEKDALVINLAGRERMLSQQITWLALLPSNHETEEALIEAMQLFESNLYALRDGGMAERADGALVLLPATQEAIARARLEEAIFLWQELKEQVASLQEAKANLISLPSSDLQTSFDDAEAEAAQALKEASLRLVAALDRVVDAYEEDSQAKVTRLVWVQIGFLGIALLALFLGSLIVRRQLLSPLEQLNVFTRRIGEGNLQQPVHLPVRNELGELARVMEVMRQQLAVWREELEARVRQRTRELEAAFNFSQEMVSEHHLEHLLEAIVERCKALTQARRAHLCLLNPQGSALSLAARDGYERAREYGAPLRSVPDYEQAREDGTPLRSVPDYERADYKRSVTPGEKPLQPVDHGLAHEVINEGKVVYRREGCLDCAYLRSAGEVACVAAPLKFGHVTLGALCVVRPPEQPFSAEEMRALHLLANTAAIAIANARLLEREKMLAQQYAVQAERERMAAELHDHLAQTLSYLRLKVERLENTPSMLPALEEELRSIRLALETAYKQVRASISGYKPALEGREKLETELRECVRAFQVEATIPIELKVFNPAAFELPPSLTAQVVHIVREALHNVRKHSQANLVQVLLDVHDGKACFSVQDNGCGFDLSQVESNEHLGLLIMRTRAERCGGELEVHSEIGKGTRITLHIPLAKEMV